MSYKKTLKNDVKSFAQKQKLVNKLSAQFFLRLCLMGQGVQTILQLDVTRDIRTWSAGVSCFLRPLSLISGLPEGHVFLVDTILGHGDVSLISGSASGSTTESGFGHQSGRPSRPLS